MQEVRQLVARHEQPAEQELRQDERRQELHRLELGRGERGEEQSQRRSEHGVDDGDEQQQPGVAGDVQPEHVHGEGRGDDGLDRGERPEREA